MSDKITKDDVVKFIEGMTVLELSALVKELEEKFGVSAAAPMMAAVAVGGAAPAAAAEEKTEFDAILTGFGAEKIQVIKVVRAITNLGLRKQKIWWKVCPRLSKKLFPKTKRPTSKRKLKKWAEPSRLNNLVANFILNVM
jgi:large subunit ribosomal protein L7/L12